MSGLLNLSDTLAAACNHAAHSGDSLRPLLSPSPVSSGTGSSSGSSTQGVTFAAVGRQMSGHSSSPGLEGGRVSGEFFLRAGGSGGDLSVFVLNPECASQLCLGTVNGGIKFYTLGRDKCTFSTHSRKVNVDLNHVYILGGKNAAFTHHHIPAVLLGPNLPAFLKNFARKKIGFVFFSLF
jgi:hypothetical protein